MVMMYKKLIRTDSAQGDSNVIDGEKLIDVGEGVLGTKPLSRTILIETRQLGEFKGQAFYLNETYQWFLGKDSTETLCLVPVRRHA